MVAGFDVIPVGAEEWPDLQSLFGRGGASNGCWCQYWLLGADYHRRDRMNNRHDLQQQAQNGSAGLLAYRDGKPVAWARFTPREELSWLTARFGRSGLLADGAWALACFYVPWPDRGIGAMRALIRDAAQWARREGVPVEGYPIDPDVPGATRNRFSGVLPPFLEEGFTEIGRIAPDRAIVRLG